MADQETTSTHALEFAPDQNLTTVIVRLKASKTGAIGRINLGDFDESKHEKLTRKELKAIRAAEEEAAARASGQFKDDEDEDEETDGDVSTRSISEAPKMRTSRKKKTD